jgi:hypothetical protein
MSNSEHAQYHFVYILINKRRTAGQVRHFALLNIDNLCLSLFLANTEVVTSLVVMKDEVADGFV